MDTVIASSPGGSGMLLRSCGEPAGLWVCVCPFQELHRAAGWEQGMGRVPTTAPLALLGSTQVLQVREWEQTWRESTTPALSPSAELTEPHNLHG